MALAWRIGSGAWFNGAFGSRRSSARANRRAAHKEPLIIRPLGARTSEPANATLSSPAPSVTKKARGQASARCAPVL